MGSGNTFSRQKSEDRRGGPILSEKKIRHKTHESVFFSGQNPRGIGFQGMESPRKDRIKVFIETFAENNLYCNLLTIRGRRQNVGKRRKKGVKTFGVVVRNGYFCIRFREGSGRGGGLEKKVSKKFGGYGKRFYLCNRKTKAERAGGGGGHEKREIFEVLAIDEKERQESNKQATVKKKRQRKSMRTRKEQFIQRRV